MKKYLLIACGLLLFGAAPAAADVVYYPPSVTGKKARRHARFLLYAQNLKADKKCVFNEYGYTPHRLRFNFAGKITERWQYPDQGKEFTFDREGNLIETRDIAVEHRRSWVYQK